jgi:hypothetical protein
MKWHVFAGRRRLDVPMWLKAQKIRSYNDLVEWCKPANVEAPPKDVTKGWFGVRKKLPAVTPAQDVPKTANVPKALKKKAPKASKKDQ